MWPILFRGIDLLSCDSARYLLFQWRRRFVAALHIRDSSIWLHQHIYQNVAAAFGIANSIRKCRLRIERAGVENPI
jgi:hypothetical protein